MCSQQHDSQKPEAEQPMCPSTDRHKQNGLCHRMQYSSRNMMNIAFYGKQCTLISCYHVNSENMLGAKSPTKGHNFYNSILMKYPE